MADIGRTPPGHLAVACLKCEARFATVPVADVIAGHTYICPKCSTQPERPTRDHPTH